MLSRYISLSLAFALGAIMSYSLTSNSTAELDNSENNLNSAYSVPPKNRQNNELTNIENNTSSTAQLTNIALYQQKIEQLKIKLAQLTNEAKVTQTVVDNTEQAPPHEKVVETLQNKLSEYISENMQLKQQLKALQPSTVSNEDIKALFPGKIGEQLSYSQTNMREEIYEYHQLEEDLDWGYIKQQEIYDFIIAQPNSSAVTITALSCKIDTCELILEENSNLDTLQQSNLTQDEITKIIQTQEPAYKNIIDQLSLQPNLNLVPQYATYGRFYSYNLFKSKATTTAVKLF